MSTAYVSGKKGGICREEYVPQKLLYNAYEETKYIAEGHVLEICRRGGIRANIYRPSIVYGDSKSGKSMIFNAFYFPIRLAHFLKTVYEKDIREKGGLNAKKMGVRKTHDGKIYLPVRIEKMEEASLNLVPTL